MIAQKLLSFSFASVIAVAGAAGCKKKAGGGGGNSEFGPDCEKDFDKNTQSEKYVQCRSCEKTHRGMGSMEPDCKNAIPKPWK